MVCARLQFIFRITNDGEGRAVIQRLMAAFAPRCIQRHRYHPSFAEGLHLAYKLVAPHNLIIGRKRPRVKRYPAGSQEGTGLNAQEFGSYSDSRLYDGWTLKG